MKLEKVIELNVIQPSRFEEVLRVDHSSREALRNIYREHAKFWGKLRIDYNSENGSPFQTIGRSDLNPKQILEDQWFLKDTASDSAI